MIQFFSGIARKFGVDKSIAYSSGARVVQGFTGVFSVLFVSSFLTGVEQGFYYTFGSILALQIFFELGLTGIMTQYVAHEASHLSLSDGKFSGEERYLSRLASLVHFCAKWYTIIAIVAFVVLIGVGVVYFNKYSGSEADGVEWLIPWSIVCLTAAINLFLAPVEAILSGLGFVKEISKIRFYQQIFLPAVVWSGLACGLKLYVCGISGALGIVTFQYFAQRMGLWHVLIELYKVHVSEKVEYVKEILPYQWRIALSWVSGYFIFQLFNPVLFAVEGPVVAGQMGMTLQALNAIQGFSASWLSTKIPLYSKLIALKDYLQLDSIFKKTLLQMASVCAALLLVFFFFIAVLRQTQFSFHGTALADRFLDYGPMILMMIPVFLQQFVASWATYLRCHKKEPFLVNSIVSGVLCLCSTFFLGNAFGLYGVTGGYCAICILLFPWGYWLYYSNKKKWHNE